MKNFFRIFSILFVFSMMVGTIDAQTKTKIKSTSAKTKVKSDEPAYTERNYAMNASMSDISDISDSVRAYKSVETLLGQNVTLVYDDNTFRGNEPIRKGDFIVAVNSSLDAIKKVVDENMSMEPMDSSWTDSNTEQPAMTEETTMTAEIPGVDNNSIYYSAAQGLMAKGVTAPFEEGKTFKPGATMSEKEVYDILNTVFGYSSPGINTYTNYMSRSKFAMALNNAVATKLLQEYAVIDQRNAELEQVRAAEKARMKEEMEAAAQAKRDSLNAAYKAEQAEIERRALENESTKKHKRKKNKTKVKTDDAKMKVEEQQ